MGLSKFDEWDHHSTCHCRQGNMYPVVPGGGMTLRFFPKYMEHQPNRGYVPKISMKDCCQTCHARKPSIDGYDGLYGDHSTYGTLGMKKTPSLMNLSSSNTIDVLRNNRNNKEDIYADAYKWHKPTGSVQDLRSTGLQGSGISIDPSGRNLANFNSETATLPRKGTVSKFSFSSLKKNKSNDYGTLPSKPGIFGTLKKGSTLKKAPKNDCGDSTIFINTSTLKKPSKSSKKHRHISDVVPVVTLTPDGIPIATTPPVELSEKEEKKFRFGLYDLPRGARNSRLGSIHSVVGSTFNPLDAFSDDQSTFSMPKTNDFPARGWRKEKKPNGSKKSGVQFSDYGGSIRINPGMKRLSRSVDDLLLNSDVIDPNDSLNSLDDDSPDEEGSSQGLSDTLQHLLRRDRVGLSTSCLAPPDGSTTLTDTRRNLRNRRMSTPQPIRSRQATASFSTAQYRPRRPQLKRARSAPDLQDMSNGQKHFRKVHKDVYKVGSAAAGDLALQPPEFNSDEEGSEDSIYETISLGDSTLSLPKQTTLEEIFECEEVPTFVEALWDHVTMDGEELGFRAGDVIEVTDLSDKEWWYGRISHDQGWFPAAFVRLRANQIELITEDGDLCVTPEGDTHITHAPLQAVESISQTQARTNVVKEILHAEREYVRHLRDVVQGYVEKCNKRPEMFPAEKMSAIFGNISAIHRFSVMFMRDLERHVNLEQPHTSNIGKVFIKHSNGFEIYSEYCNNHPTACDVLRGLQKNKKYTHFFEACRLLQDMIELPLEGFLLTPVQKICKYPLQLKELLKYTPRSHPDHGKLVIALETMRRIAVMINERKRKMESLEKLAGWQHRIDDWQGPDLLEESSELIYTGEMVKVNNSGWHQERVFFLFDHQLIYCKKDMLWRDLLAYKGRISLDNCIIKALPDDIKDPVFHIQVKNGLRIYDNTQGRWYLMYCRTSEDRARWFQAFQQERQKVQEDDESGFDLHLFRQKANLPRVKPPAHPSVRYRERTQKHKKQQVRNEKLPPLPGQHSIPDSPNQSTDSTLTRRWNIFRKNKR